jgi:NAD(P)-dependent dehydrogenase (short-subunit alcohol dehydrogenase family)
VSEYFLPKRDQHNIVKMSALWDIIREFFQPPMKPDIIPSDLSFDGKAVLITGATGGLGLETAIHYVNLGANPVHITARNAARGAEAQKAIESRTGKEGVVRVWVLDMDTLAGVQKFMKTWEKNVKEIDIVLLNAGTHMFVYQESPDGWEMDLQVNVLGTTLLGLLMLQWMRSAKKPGQTQHLGFVSSGSHFDLVDISSPGFPKEDALNFYNHKQNYPGGRPQYGISKLLQQYAILEIAKLALDSEGR